MWPHLHVRSSRAVPVSALTETDAWVRLEREGRRCPLHAHPFIQSCNGAKCNAVSALTETDRMGLDVHAHAVAVGPRGFFCVLLSSRASTPISMSAWLQVAESPGATLLCSPGRFLCNLTSIENPEGIQLLWKTPDTQLFLSTHAGKKARRI